MRFSGRFTTTMLACALAAAAAMVLAPRLAAAADMDGASTVHMGAGEQARARKVDLSIGRSIVIDLPRDAKEVFVANPKIANAVVRSTRKVFIIGMADGYTSMFVMDAEGRQIAALDITVGRDLSDLRATLRRVMPSAVIDVRPAGDSILITGLVDTPLDAQRAADIAGAFVGQSDGGGGGAAAGGAAGAAGGGGGTTTGKIINSLTIRGKDQVMLKVTVAEMQRNVLKQLGVNLAGNWQLGSQISNFAINNPFSVSGGLQSGTSIPFSAGCSAVAIVGPTEDDPSLLNRACSGGKGFTQGTLQALERNGIMRTLAEPTLTAISGETATFLVGGEVPIQVFQACAVGTFCPPTVTYKPFGVSLTFTPIVLSESRISLRVATEVSEIDSTVSAGGQPGFRVRRSETTVELPSGGSLATAGLIQQTSKQAINGLPGLINLPVLGALFRSRDYQRQETELMISVTPFIAKPVAAGDIVRPDDGFIDSSDPQAVLLGRLNKLYGVTSAPVKKRGYNGHVGFITD